jgi:uracil-DNA glycosylase
MTDLIPIAICVFLGLFAASAFLETQHQRQERRKRREAEQWVRERWPRVY